MDRWLLTLCLVQGIYFTVTGVWPLVHMRSFLAVTGPKTDLWLVKTVGVLVAVIGVVIGMAGWRERVPDAVAVLAVGSAAGLMAIDVIYVVKRVISAIYLADAAAQAVLIVAWAIWFADMVAGAGAAALPIPDGAATLSALRSLCRV
jgi:hypothetical protein